MLHVARTTRSPIHPIITAWAVAHCPLKNAYQDVFYYIHRRWSLCSIVECMPHGISSRNTVHRALGEAIAGHNNDCIPPWQCHTLPHPSGTRVQVYLARETNEGLAYIGATANPSTGLFSLGSTFTAQTTWDVDFIAAHPDGTVRVQVLLAS